MLLDEPTAHLDPGRQVNVMATLRRLATERTIAASRCCTSRTSRRATPIASRCSAGAADRARDAARRDHGRALRRGLGVLVPRPPRPELRAGGRSAQAPLLCCAAFPSRGRTARRRQVRRLDESRPPRAGMHAARRDSVETSGGRGEKSRARDDRSASPPDSAPRRVRAASGAVRTGLCISSPFGPTGSAPPRALARKPGDERSRALPGRADLPPGRRGDGRGPDADAHAAASEQAERREGDPVRVRRRPDRRRARLLRPALLHRRADLRRVRRRGGPHVSLGEGVPLLRDPGHR